MNINEYFRTREEVYKGYKIRMTSGIDTMTRAKPWHGMGKDNLVLRFEDLPEDKPHLWLLGKVANIVDKSDLEFESSFVCLMFDSKAVQDRLEEQLDEREAKQQTKLFYENWKKFVNGQDAWFVIHMQITGSDGNRCEEACWSTRNLASGPFFKRTWEEHIVIGRQEVDTLISGN